MITKATINGITVQDTQPQTLTKGKHIFYCEYGTGNRTAELEVTEEHRIGTISFGDTSIELIPF
jgi:hypothetical protein